MVLEGYIEKIIFRNDENGYTVLSVVIDEDNDETEVMIGYVEGATEGLYIRAEGEMVDHKMYEQQFKISAYELHMPEDVDSMERYLSSGAIKGIGQVLELLFKIIDSYPGEKGVPIGSYLSQYLANFYLSYFDHWLKEKMGVKAVVRYMDDIVIFHWSGKYLHWLLHQMEDYLKKNLDLKVKPNHQVFPTAIRGVDFVGYRFFFGYKLLRKKTCKKMKKKMLQIKAKQDAGKLLNYREWCSGNSYIGWLMWCDSWRLYEKYIEPIIPSLLRYYKEVICKHFVTEEAGLVSFEEYKQKLLKKKGRLIA